MILDKGLSFFENTLPLTVFYSLVRIANVNQLDRGLRKKTTVAKKKGRKGIAKRGHKEGSFPWPYGAKTYGWLNKIEAVLEKQAILAGIHEHSTTVGTAREFFVQQVLRTILPPMAHIGTGIIVDANGSPSQQIDIIVYDPRFPVLEISPGIGSYFIEGVIATVEVKSTLDGKSLLGALNNCLSAKCREVNWDIAQIAQRARESRQAPSCHILQMYGEANEEDLVMSKVLSQLLPKTYIFAFSSEIKKSRTVAEHVQDWFDQRGQPLIGYEPCVPNVIVAGESCGTQCHHRAIYPAHIVEMQRRSVWPIMSLWKAPRHGDGGSNRLGLLICDLLIAVCQRLGTRHFGERVDYGPEGHL